MKTLQYVVGATLLLMLLVVIPARAQSNTATVQPDCNSTDYTVYQGQNKAVVQTVKGKQCNYSTSAGSTGTLTDGSGTVTTGGTSQQVFAADPNRHYLFCGNPRGAIEDLYINFTSAASTTDGKSIDLGPGGTFWFEDNFISTEAVNVTAAGTGHAFICKEG